MRRFWIVVASALTLCACASVQKLDAAADVHALLLSIRDNDQAAFDAHIDRPALKRELERRLAAEAVARDSTGLAAIFAPAIADIAGEALIQPATFRYVAEQYGYGPATQIPNPIVISTQLKSLPDGRVCATRKKDGPCVLLFSKEGPDWRLSGFEGSTKELRLLR